MELTCSVQPKDIIRTNVLTMFHAEVLTRINSPTPDIIGTNLTINVASRATGTIFELVQDIMDKCPSPLRQYIIGTHFLTKVHEDRTIHVATRVLTKKMVTPPDGQKAVEKANHEHFVLR
ncbi:hypothetical protein DPMN_106764 [Dreissena polymorpha]|uniref:Uncharacterized protein n=1 Tax=Dreissena polymorpha TaxID=45954 RepID=A0A9D4K5R5_DREPO|nr:hypothetical protein DPMN_106764 [Dreissena polymorpha]